MFLAKILRNTKICVQRPRALQEMGVVSVKLKHVRCITLKCWHAMPYEVINGFGGGDGNVRVVDLRSDTISKPTPEMRTAMAKAEVGDDVFGEDPTVKELERRAAELLGKESAVFLPSGTMANLISIMVHCNQRGSEIIVGDNSHVFRFEQGGAAQIAGVQLALVKNKEDGTFCLDELKSRIRINPDCHEPYTSLIVVENTHNMCGGKALPLEWLDELAKIAKEHNIPLHMDGARLMNAFVYQKVDPKRIVKNFNSVCFCLSKSLGCPIGSVLVGSYTFIEKARRMRKALGGGMRQSGIVAAAGLVALDNMIYRLQQDHEHIYQIAQAIHNLNSKMFQVDLSTVQTNILMVYLDKNKVNSKQVLERLATVLNSDSVKVKVRAGSRDSACIRFVIYWEITDDDVKAAIEKIVFTFKEFINSH